MTTRPDLDLDEYERRNELYWQQGIRCGLNPDLDMRRLIVRCRELEEENKRLRAESERAWEQVDGG